jgi:hypothetical protein
VFENRVLRRIFGPKRDEVTGEWRKLHNEEFRDLYSSPSIIRIIKSWRMRWAGHVTRKGSRGTLIDFWWKGHKERHNYGDQEEGGRIILKWILETKDGAAWTGHMWLRTGTFGGLL